MSLGTEYLASFPGSTNAHEPRKNEANLHCMHNLLPYHQHLHLEYITFLCVSVVGNIGTCSTDRY